MKNRNDGLDRTQKAPASQVYWNDLLHDLMPLSDAARGLWITMLCYMALSPQKGKLVWQNGAVWTEEDVLAVSQLGKKSFKLVFLELTQKSVFSFDENGAIYNRRMVRDAELSRIRQLAGNKGVEARKTTVLVNQTDNFGQPNAEQNGSKPQNLVDQKSDFGQPKREQTLSKTLARASAPSSSSSVRLTDRLTDEQNAEPKPTDGLTDGLTPIGLGLRLPTATENGGTELAELLKPEVQELLDGHGEDCGIPGGAPPAIVERCVAAIVSTGRYADVPSVEAIYPAVLAQKLHAAKKPPKSWKWFATVTENAAKECDL